MFDLDSSLFRCSKASKRSRVLNSNTLSILVASNGQTWPDYYSDADEVMIRIGRIKPNSAPERTKSPLMAFAAANCFFKCVHFRRAGSVGQRMPLLKIPPLPRLAKLADLSIQLTVSATRAR